MPTLRGFGQALASAGRKLTSHKDGKVHYGEAGPTGDVPKVTLPIQFLARDIIGSICGPDAFFADLAGSLTSQGSLDSSCFDGEESPSESILSDSTLPAPEFDGLSWVNKTHQLAATSVSLYDINPATGQHNGDPIADCYGAIQYEDGAILAVADGVNWGAKPKLAARCAVFGALRSLHTTLNRHPATDSTRMFYHMLQAVNAAQQTIIQKGGTLTTLVITVVARCPTLKNRYAVMTVSVGDSAAFAFHSSSGSLLDLTAACRQSDAARDPRNCQGCLGYALGEDPDLSNMSLSLSTAAPGDLLLLTSDGIIDNFDPVMRKEAMLAGGVSMAAGLPVIAPQAAHQATVDMIGRKLRSACVASARAMVGPVITASSAVAAVIEEAQTITHEHRATITRCSRKATLKHRSEQDVLVELLSAKGKLDHATALAFQCPPLV